jgi:hypothetical protein
MPIDVWSEMVVIVSQEHFSGRMVSCLSVTAKPLHIIYTGIKRISHYLSDVDCGLFLLPQRRGLLDPFITVKGFRLSYFVLDKLILIS